MPAVKPGATVLVTGANGYIALWIVKYLLEKGYIVRGTVRSEEKGVHMKKLFGSHGDKLQLIYVADITKPGVFDEAVQGVDAILHTASPFHFNAVEPSELIDPAVKGTTGILESALKHPDARLKRIVILSSCASVSNPSDLGELTEANWNTENQKEIEAKGRDASQAAKYRASKSMAERAGWDFFEKHRSSIGWELVTLCPPFVFGPFLHEVSSPSSLNTSAKLFFDNVIKGTGPPELLTSVQEAWIDVRDVALAHINAIEHEKAGGERFIITSGTFTYQDFLDAGNELTTSDPSLGVTFIKGPHPGFGKTLQYRRSYVNKKSVDVLGMVYKDKKTTLTDTVADFKAKGWL